MSNREQAKTEFEEGSGNVFADLGLEDANERFARAQLGFHVYKILEDRKLKQRKSLLFSGSSNRKCPIS